MLLMVVSAGYSGFDCRSYCNGHIVEALMELASLWLDTKIQVKTVGLSYSLFDCGVNVRFVVRVRTCRSEDDVAGEPGPTRKLLQNVVRECNISHAYREVLAGKNFEEF